MSPEGYDRMKRLADVEMRRKRLAEMQAQAEKNRVAIRDAAMKISEAFRDLDFSAIERRITLAFPASLGKTEATLDNLASFRLLAESFDLVDESHSFKRTGTTPKKGKIIKSFVRDGRIYTLHATKGWRSRKVAG